MTSAHIRKAVERDMPEIAALIRSREGTTVEAAARRTELFEWTAFRNPSVREDGTYFVAEQNGAIVAHLGRMPVDFYVNGKRDRFYFPHDLFVHPACRKGMGFFLSMALYEAWEEETDSVLCNMWISPLNLQLQKLRKYSEVQAPIYIRYIDARHKFEQYFRHRLPAQLCATGINAAFSAYGFVQRPFLRASLDIRRVERFDDSMDSSMQRLCAGYRICPCRTSALMNWKYIDRPYSRFASFLAIANSEPKGVLVLYVDDTGLDRRGIIFDLIVDPSDLRTISALVEAAVEHCRDRKAESLECLVTNQYLARSLRKLQFIRAHRQESITLRADVHFESKDEVMKFANWFLVKGDSDGALWI